MQMNHTNDASISDLERILGYAYAIDESAPITKVADELFVMSCWTQQFCSDLLEQLRRPVVFLLNQVTLCPGTKFLSR